MNVAIITFLLVLVFLGAFLGIDIAIRPTRYEGGQNSASALLDAVARHLLPQLNKPLAYRIVGATLAVTAFATASAIVVTSLAPLVDQGP